MPTIHYKHLHQHQQSFVTLNSPSPFDAAPQTRCIPQITIYPELEAEEPRAFHKRRQLAEILIYLLIDLVICFPFRHHAKSNIHFMFPFACFHLVLCASSVHLRIFSTLHAPLFLSKRCLPYAFSTLVCI